MNARSEVRRVCEAVVYAYEHDTLSAAQVLGELGESASEREELMFSALLAVVQRDAELLGIERLEHARRLIAYYS